MLESCEYCDSFLNFFPTLAVVLNVEADHLDYFHDLADIQKSFRKFAQLVPKGTGRVLANGDDPNTMEALKGLELTTFGLGEKNRVRNTEQLALLTAVMCGLLVTAAFVFIPRPLIGLFVSPTVPAATIAMKGFPLFAIGFIPFILNLLSLIHI